MAKYLCVHNCIFKGDYLRKGSIVQVADEDDDPQLRNTHAFRRCDVPDPAADVAPPPANERTALLLRLDELGVDVPDGRVSLEKLREMVADAGPEVAEPGDPKVVTDDARERDVLRQKLQELKVSLPKGEATLGELRAMLAEAADPRGNPTLI